MAQDSKVVRDGMVAVLYSPGFGAGWYSWCSERALLFDPELVAAVETKDDARILKRAEEIEPGGYFGGSDQLKIGWVPEGSQFEIHEYDGSESIRTLEGRPWLTA